MKRKIFVVFTCLLLITALSPLSTAINTEKNESKELHCVEPIVTPLDEDPDGPLEGGLDDYRDLEYAGMVVSLSISTAIGVWTAWLNYKYGNTTLNEFVKSVGSNCLFSLPFIVLYAGEALDKWNWDKDEF